MPWSWPAEVNLHEARAFCNWRSARDGTPYKLQTEAQSMRLRGDATTATGGCDAAPTDPVMVSRGDEIATKHGLNLNLAYSTPWPVDSSHGGVDGVHPNPHSRPTLTVTLTLTLTVSHGWYARGPLTLRIYPSSYLYPNPTPTPTLLLHLILPLMYGGAFGDVMGSVWEWCDENVRTLTLTLTLARIPNPHPDPYSEP